MYQIFLHFSLKSVGVLVNTPTLLAKETMTMRPEVGYKWHMIMDHLDKDKKMAASTLWAVFQLADRAVAFVTPVVEYWLKSI